jgi:GNAT superfamily N-acetyltransferase
MDADFRELLPADLPRLGAAMGLPDPAPIEARFENGRRCFGFESSDRIVSFGWVTQGPEETGELERVLTVPAGEAYIWDCGTVPEHRRLGFYSALLNRTLAHLADEGAPRVWIGASRLNLPSIHGIANAGFRHVLDLTYRRWAALTLIYLRPAADVPPAIFEKTERILLKPGERRIGRFAFGWQP